MRTMPLLVCAALAALPSCGQAGPGPRSDAESGAQTQAESDTAPAAGQETRTISEVVKESRMAEARPVLKQLVTLQQAYREQEGTYAKSLEELAAVGWETIEPAFYHVPEIVVAQADRLCAVMRPKRPGLPAARVDETAEVVYGQDCR